MRVGDIATGRSGDKGDILDLTLVSETPEHYKLLYAQLTPMVVKELVSPLLTTEVIRYELEGLNALKFVFPTALPGGVYASMHAGLHWQKAAIWLLLDHELLITNMGVPLNESN
jgi:hypothetical protein